MFHFYGVRTTGYYCLTSYHSSIVKVLVPRAGFYLLVPSLSRALLPFREIKQPMFSLYFGQHRPLMRLPCGSGLGLFNCYGFALQHISQRQSILPLSTVLSRGFGTSLLVDFSTFGVCSMSIRAGRPSEFSYLAFTGLPCRAKPLCYLQRAGLYSIQLLCQGILRPI